MNEWDGADDHLYQGVTNGKYPVQKNSYVTLRTDSCSLLPAFSLSL